MSHRRLVVDSRPGVLLGEFEQMARAVGDVDDLGEQAADAAGRHRLPSQP
ncbi:hypothetical protein [Rhizobacter sp. SG703]|nr:hypothetical protein [Rhizobacter sp. SG703]NKI96407.1 hypothetical protein [Rhizobacter sp. SG703]